MMKMSFRQSIISLLVIVATLETLPAHADAYQVVNYAVYPTSAGTTQGYVTMSTGNNGPVFFMDNPGPETLIALATATQMKSAVAWFYGPGGTGQYGDFTVQNSGGHFTTIELYNPAVNGPDGIPFDIYAQNGLVDAWSTCAACRNEMTLTQLLTSNGWYNSFGYAVPVGALAAIYSAFASQYTVSLTGIAPITAFTVGGP